MKFPLSNKKRKNISKSIVTSLVLLMFVSNIPFGAVDFIIQKIKDRNVVDVLWQSEQDDSVVDSFKPDIARAAENTVDTAITNATAEFAPSPSMVFTTDQIGYIFFIDAGNDLKYSKTTNGGTNWGAAVTIDATITGWITTAVWYDQWTPGDTTGTKIHIAAADTASDDIFYTYLDTNGDTLKGSMVSAVPGTATLTTGADGPPSITKGAGGALFISGNFTSTAGGKVYKSTDGAGATWANATPVNWSTVAIDQIQLLPLKTDDDIIAIKAQTADNTIRYRIYDEVTDTWDGAWSSSIASLTESTVYDQWFAATIKKSTGDVYLSFANQTTNAANDVEFWSFTDSGRTWSQKTNIFTNDATVIAPVPIMDESTGDIYLAYLRGSLAADMNVYYKKSTDGGTTWGDESVKLNEFADDHKALRSNLLSDDVLYVAWYNDDLNDIYTSRVVDGIEVSIDNAITDGTDEYGTSPSVVFTDDQTGYVFFIDAGNDLAYRKTTNGGANWGNSVIIDNVVTTWTNLAVWYDQWTPGDNSGTKIHIAVSDDGTDDIFYTFLDTSGDTLKGSMVSAVLGSTTLTETTDGPPSITKGAGGALFISGNFTSTAGGKVSKSTDGAGASWTDVTPASWSTVAADQIQLLPLLTDNDIIAIKAQTASDAIYYRIYDEVADTWDGSWSYIAALTDNATYDQWFSATIKKSTGDVYLALANNTTNAANDIEFWTFDESTRVGFSQQDNVLTNDANAMMPVPMMDEDTGHIYVAYLSGTAGATTQVYYKYSIDGGNTWSSASSSISPGIVDDMKYVRGNLLSGDRLYAVWYNDDLDDLQGTTIPFASLTPTTTLTNGEFVYLANDQIATYSVDGSGNLTFNDTDNSNGVADIWSNGQYVFVADTLGAGELKSYAVDGYGNLTFIDSDSRGIDYGAGVWGDGEFVYLANYSGGIHSYSVDTSGNITYVDSDDQGTALDVWGDGEFIYVANNTGGLLSYSVDGSGNLTLIDTDNQGSPYVDVWGDGEFIYVANEVDGLLSYSVDGSGNLTFIDWDDQGIGLGVGGDGEFVYVADDTSGLLSYSVDGSGNLTFIDSDNQAENISAVWSDGDFVYAANGAGGMYTYSVDGSGNITFIDSDDPGGYEDVEYGVFGDLVNSTVGPGSGPIEIGRFGVGTNIGSDTVTGMTVTLAGNASAYENVATVDVQTLAGVSKCSATPSSNTVNLTSCGIAVTQTSTIYKIVITPKTHANMPASPGATYATTATVTSITATNGTAGADTGSATITIDNSSPAGVTSATAAETGMNINEVILNWTNPADADFEEVVILQREGSAVADVPEEGTSYLDEDVIGSSTVACVTFGTSCSFYVPTAGTYYYEIFTKDAYGNYDTGTIPTGSPVTTTVPTTTLGDGTDPGNSTIAPGASVTDFDAFTLQTNSGTDTVTALTVTLSDGGGGVGNLYENIAKVEITDASNADECTDIDNPASLTLNFTGCSLSVTTSSTPFKVRITPKTHANMPAVPGASYSTVASVTSITATNSTAGTDSGSTITVDNLSPNAVTSSTATAGNTVVDLAWTNPGADFDEVIVLRHTSAISDVPVEGTEYSVGNTIGSATVACNTASTTCQDTSLSNGTVYHYKIFTQDTNGNYNAGTVPGASPVIPEAPLTGAPVVAGISSGVGDTTGNATRTINLPSSIAAGDLLIIFWTHNGGSSTTTPSGFNLLQDHATNSSGSIGETTYVWYKIAAGGETSVTTTLSSGTRRNAYVVYRITDWHGTTPPEAVTATTGTSVNPNASSITPSWGSDENLYITMAASYSDVAPITAFPTNYNKYQKVASTTNASGASIGVGARDVASSSDDPGNFTIGSSVRWIANTFAVRPAVPSATTTLGDGTDGGNSTIAPGASATEIDRFSLATNTGTDTVTGLTVTLAPAGAFNNLGTVGVYTTGDVLKCESSSWGGDLTVELTSCGISVTTTPTDYVVKITPLSHASMPAVPGASYATTATVTAITATNGTAGTDTDSATITVDNASPAGVTSSTATPGDTVVDLAWTNPADADFDEIVVLRRASSAVADVPVEGTEYSVGNTIGTATVACVTATTSCQDTSLSNGTAYHYEIFTQDTNGNYDAGVVPAGSPATPPTTDNILFIQQKTFSAASSVSLDSLPTAGNALVLVVAGPNEVVPSGGGCTWVLQRYYSSYNKNQIWVCYNTSGAGGTADISWTGGSGMGNISEWSGVMITDPTDTNAVGAAGTGGTTNIGTDLTPTADGNYLIISTVYMNAGGSYSSGPNSGFNALATPNDGQFFLAFDVISSASGSYGTRWVADNSQNRTYIIVSIKESLPPVTTLGDGTDGGNSTIAPGASATEIDRFSLATNTGTDTVTGLTVTLAPAGAFNNLGTVGVYTTGDVLKCSSSSWGGDLTVELSSCAIDVTTTPTDYVVKITPLSHASMPAVPGASYATTATVTSITATNSTAGTDTDSATITVDNLSPDAVTSSTATAGNTVVDLAWTNPGADFDEVIVLRHTSAISDVPVEGTEYSVGNTIGSATVACNTASTSCQDTSLSNGTAYHYKIFTQDTNGNYDAGTVPTGSPATPFAGIAISGTTDLGDASNVIKIAINGQLNAATGSISSGTWSIVPIGENPTAGQVVTVFVDGVADSSESTAVAKYDGTGDMTGMILNANVLSIGSDDNQSLTLTEVGGYDCGDDEDVMYSATGSFWVEGGAGIGLCAGSVSNSYTDETLSIEAGNTLSLDGHYVLTDNFNVSGTFVFGEFSEMEVYGNMTIASGGVFTKTTGNNIYFVSGETSTLTDNNVSKQDLGNVVLDDYGEGSMVLELGSSVKISKLRIYDGHELDFNGSNTLTVTGSGTGLSRPIINDGGVFTRSSGTVEYTGTSATEISSVTSDNITFNNLSLLPAGNVTYTLGTANSQTVTVAGTLTVGNASDILTLSGTTYNPTMNVGKINVASNSVFNAPTATLTLTGSGTGSSRPLINGETFNVGSSTIAYTGTSATDISNVTSDGITYNNLTLAPSSGSPTYNLGTATSQTFTVDGNLVIGTGSDVVTVTADTYDPTINLSGNVTIDTSAVFTKGSGVVTLSGESTLTDNTASKQDLGLVTIAGGAGGEYSFYRTITIDHTKVPNTNQTNFPVLISGTYDYLATVANGGDVQNANGYDIIFTSDSAGTSLLNWEVEKYTATTGAVVYWVKVPSVSASEDTTIYMHYGNSEISTDQSGDAYEVWDSNYKAVYHMDNNAADTTVSDSAIADMAGTYVSENTNAKTITGKIGSALDFDGSTDYITVSQGANYFDVSGGAFTVQAWVQDDTTPASLATTFHRIISWYDGSKNIQLGLARDASTTQRSFYLFNAASGNAAVASTGDAANGLRHVVGTYDGASTYKIYVDGQDLSGDTLSAAIGVFTSNSTTMYFARRGDSAGYTDGIIDEIRISSTNRSADWIATEYNNHNSPSTFYAVGSETPVTGGSTISLGSSAKVTKLTINSGQTLNTNGTNTLTLTGSGEAGSRPLINAGTFTQSTGTVEYTGTSATEISDVTSDGITYYNLSLKPAGTVTYKLGTASSQTLTATGTLTVGDGSNALTLDGGTYNPTLSVGGLTIDTGSSFTVPTSTTLSGNLTNNGTYTHNSGTLTVAPTTTVAIGGTNNITFNNFTVNPSAGAGKTITFKNGNTYTFSGDFDVAGQSGNVLAIRSDSSGDQWFTTFNSTADAVYISLKDSGCTGGNNVTATSRITNLGNNGSCWRFIVKSSGGGGVEASATPDPDVGGGGVGGDDGGAGGEGEGQGEQQGGGGVGGDGGGEGDSGYLFEPRFALEIVIPDVTFNILRFLLSLK